MSTSKSAGRAADDQARDYTDEAIQTFAEVMRDPLAEHRDRLRAAENLVERGHGKAVTPIAVMPGQKLKDQLAALTNDQLIQIIEQNPLPKLAAPVQDVEFEELDPEVDPLLR